MDDRQLLFEQRLNDYNFLRELYRSGAMGGLDKYEMELLRFCHDTDMPQYLKENVWDKPIVLDENGNLDRERTLFKSSRTETIHDNAYQQQPTPQVTPQKFFYLYDDNGKLIAAIPQG